MDMLLNLTWILPALVAGLLMCMPKEKKSAIRIISLIAAVVNIGIIAVLTINFAGLELPAGAANETVLAYVTQVEWFPALHIEYYVGVDGFSLLMMLMASIIALCGILVSWRIDDRCKEFFVLLSFLLAGTYGCFISFDLFTFFLFNEITLIPTYLLIGIFGSGKKEFAAMKLNLMLFGGSALIVVGMAGLYIEGGRSFNMIDLAQMDFSLAFQYWAFPTIFLGFAVLSSVFPFHTWSPAGHAAAPTAISMFLAGVHMKLGGYGCLRVAMYILPDGANEWMSVFLVLATISVVYGAFIAVRQKDLKFINAYSSISHVGMVVFGFAVLGELAIRGAVMQMISHGFVTSLVFALIGSIYSRTHTRQIDEMGGLMKKIPFLSVAFVLAGFAVVGMPGTSSFAAELTIFIGSFQAANQAPGPFMMICSVLCVLTIVTTAVYVLRTVNKVVNGPLPELSGGQAYDFPDADRFEKAAIFILLGCIFAMGLYPQWIADMVDQAMLPILHNLNIVTASKGS